MTYQIPGFTITLSAGADLSAAQFRFVKLDASGQAIVCAAATDIPVGVLQNKPDVVGAEAEVMIDGVTKVQADAALTPGTLIGTSADGQADAKVPGTDITEYVVGQILEGAAAAGNLAAALINCAAPHRAA